MVPQTELRLNPENDKKEEKFSQTSNSFNRANGRHLGSSQHSPRSPRRLAEQRRKLQNMAKTSASFQPNYDYPNINAPRGSYSH